MKRGGINSTRKDIEASRKVARRMASRPTVEVIKPVIYAVLISRIQQTVHVQPCALCSQKEREAFVHKRGSSNLYEIVFIGEEDEAREVAAYWQNRRDDGTL